MIEVDLTDQDVEVTSHKRILISQRSKIVKSAHRLTFNYDNPSNQTMVRPILVFFTR